MATRGDIRVVDGSGREVFNFDANYAILRIGADGNESDIRVLDGSGREVFNFDANNAVLRVGASGNEGDIRVLDGSGRQVFNFDANNAILRTGADGNEGDIRVLDGSGREVFNFDAKYAILRIGADGNEGDIRVRDGDGNETIRLDGNTGDIELVGADWAEESDVSDEREAEPGSIMVIDDNGALRPCDSAYDKRVAGVISGAGGLSPGTTLGKQRNGAARRPLALVGKSFCKVDADYEPIEIGDLLTTSPTGGHAMKASDHTQ